MKDKIAVVDDEPYIAEVARLYLEHAGYQPLLVDHAAEVLPLLREHSPSLVILDVMLPDGSGFDVCRSIRSMSKPFCDVPVIMLTARGEAFDKLEGFNVGADDYLVKPFDPSELIARVKAVLRRSKPEEAAIAPADPSLPLPIRIGALTIDFARYRVELEGSRIDLTPKETELLYFLASKAGRVFSRDDLLAGVWAFDFPGGTRTVDAHVKNLRKKLGSHPEWRIETLWGIGYSFEVTAHEKG
ncbi:response regulator transcription factor [Paenibacillus chitinolyticus]|uniref:response regulator transcription factor n=1 Tax=Paenibacillus chitinolyticus TaxID=79263 RepID=UPI003D039F30